MDSIAQALPQDFVENPSLDATTSATVAPISAVTPTSVGERSWGHPWIKVFKLVNHVTVHSAGAAGIVAIFSLFDLIIERLAPFNHLIFLEGTQYCFGLSHIFKWADLFVIVSFVVSGLWQVVKEMFR